MDMALAKASGMLRSDLSAAAMKPRTKKRITGDVSVSIIIIASLRILQPIAGKLQLASWGAAAIRNP